MALEVAQYADLRLAVGVRVPEYMEDNDVSDFHQTFNSLESILGLLRKY
jgi:hypothetical protein